MTTTVLKPKWLTVQQVASLLNFSVSKTKTLVSQRKIRSVKDGGHRRVLPEWVDDYVARTVEEYSE